MFLFSRGSKKPLGASATNEKVYIDSSAALMSFTIFREGSAFDVIYKMFTPWLVPAILPIIVTINALLRASR